MQATSQGSSLWNWELFSLSPRRGELSCLLGSCIVGARGKLTWWSEGPGGRVAKFPCPPCPGNATAGTTAGPPLTSLQRRKEFERVRDQDRRGTFVVLGRQTRFISTEGVEAQALKEASCPPECSPQVEDTTLQPLLHEILSVVPVLTQATTTPGDTAEVTQVPVHCGRTKVFMTDSLVRLWGCGAGPDRGTEKTQELSGPLSMFQLELLEQVRAQVLEQCARCIQGSWRQYQHHQRERQRWAATLIQAGRSSKPRLPYIPHSSSRAAPVIPAQIHLIAVFFNILLSPLMVHPCRVLGFPFPGYSQTTVCEAEENLFPLSHIKAA